MLQRLQLPPLQPITPPPELQQRAPTPPQEQVEHWDALELEVADFDGNNYSVTVTQPSTYSSRKWYPCRSTSRRDTSSRHRCRQ